MNVYEHIHILDNRRLYYKHGVRIRLHSDNPELLQGKETVRHSELTQDT